MGEEEGEKQGLVLVGSRRHELLDFIARMARDDECIFREETPAVLLLPDTLLVPG